jgi:hypothetical protein
LELEKSSNASFTTLVGFDEGGPYGFVESADPSGKNDYFYLAGRKIRALETTDDQTLFLDLCTGQLVIESENHGEKLGFINENGEEEYF